MVPVGYRETSNSFLKSYIFVGTGRHETPTPEAEFHVPLRMEVTCCVPALL